jgi:hypothetical protein
MWLNLPKEDHFKRLTQTELKSLVQQERKRAQNYRTELGDMIADFHANGVSHASLAPLLSSMIGDVMAFDRNIAGYQLQMALLENESFEDAQKRLIESDWSRKTLEGVTAPQDFVRNKLMPQ